MGFEIRPPFICKSSCIWVSAVIMKSLSWGRAGLAKLMSACDYTRWHTRIPAERNTPTVSNYTMMRFTDSCVMLITAKFRQEVQFQRDSFFKSSSIIHLKIELWVVEGFQQSPEGVELLLSFIQRLPPKTAPVATNLTLNTRLEGIKEQHGVIILKKNRERVGSFQWGS